MFKLLFPFGAPIGPVVFNAFIDGAAVFVAGPFDKLKFMSESFNAPMLLQVEPTAVGFELLAGKALVCGSEGGPWGANKEAPPKGCIIFDGGNEAMESPSNKSMLEFVGAEA